MTFRRRYLTRLLAPPAIAIAPIALLFLHEVTETAGVPMTSLVALFVAVYAAAAVAFALALRAPVDAVTSRGDGAALSHLLRLTLVASAALWLGAGLVMSILATFLFFPTFLGFSYFATAALILAAPSIAWDYFAAKQMLVERAADGDGVHYQGREISLGRKIAVVFIGFFIVSSLALVQLVSAKISTTLEQVAVDREQDRFDAILSEALAAGTIDAAFLQRKAAELPEGYGLTLLSGESVIEAGARLSPATLTPVRRLRSGDSTRFVAPEVTRFVELPDGSILALTIPWGQFQSVPGQIATYTFIIAFLTALVFSIATWFVQRDVTAPLKELRSFASEIAKGRFDRDVRIFSDDEVGAVGESFSETSANLQRLVSSIGGSGASIAEGARVINGGTERLLSRTTEQNRLTEASTSSLERVRAHAESVRSAVETVSSLTEDASGRSLELQATSEQIARNMDELVQSVEKTTSSTAEMSATSHETNQRTEVLGGIGDEVLSFVAEMESTIEELRRNAETTAEISRGVQERAVEGGDSVAETVAGIESAQQSTRRAASVIVDLQKQIGHVSQILSVIEEIAQKTNLLSLNAAIIAAQAGQEGSAFSVVADEIRELADRTRGSTREIATIIKTVQGAAKDAVVAIDEGVGRVDQNVQLAQRASEALAAIVQSASESYGMSNRISSALQEQSQASRHLHEVSSKMSDQILEIRRATQEQARGAQLLAEEAERVREIAREVSAATDEQSTTGSGISEAMEQIASDLREIRALLDEQLADSETIAKSADAMLEIARSNEAIARDFNQTVQGFMRNAREFENEVARFQLRR